jgi:hypothetical protein
VGGFGRLRREPDLVVAVSEELFEVGLVVDGMNQVRGAPLWEASAAATGGLAQVEKLSLQGWHSGHLALSISSSWAVPHPEAVYRHSDSPRVLAAAHACWTRC